MAFGSNQAVGISFKGKDELSPVVRGIRNSMDGFKRDAATGFGLGAGISVFHLAQRALGAVTDYMGDAVRAASDLQESQTKVDAVFKTSAATIHDWSEDSATSFGLSKQAALESAATFGNFIQALGGTEDSANEMSRSLVELAADLASFNNQDIDEVLVALRSGLAGEAEPMRRLGADVSAARVEMELMEMGIEKVNGKFTESDKVLGRYRAILEGTEAAQGDFARTSDGLANITRQLDAQLENISADIGEALIPAVLTFATALNDDVLPSLKTLIDLLQLGGGAAQGDFSGAIKAAKGVMQAYVMESDRVVSALSDIMEVTGLTESEVLALAKANVGLVAGYDPLTHEIEDLTKRQDIFIASVMEAAWQKKRDAEAAEDLAGETDDLTGAIDDSASSMAMAKQRAAALGDQLSDVADTDLRELRQSAKETFSQFVKAIEATGNPLRELQREEQKLLILRAEAARKNQWWNLAAIDQRLDEIAVQKRAQNAARAMYDEQEQGARQASRRLGITIDQARTLARQLAAVPDVRISVEDSALDAAIQKAWALQDALGANPRSQRNTVWSAGGQSLVNEKGEWDTGRNRELNRQREREQRDLRNLRNEYRDVKSEVHAYNKSLDDTGGSGGKAAGGSDKAKKSAKELREEARKLKEEALEKWLDRVAEAAEKVSDAFQAIAKTDFVDLRDSGKEALDELRKSLEAQIDPLGIIREEVTALRQLRAEAEAAGRYDIMAAIDLRLQELAVMERQYLQMQKRYTDEGKALDILHAKLDISKKKAAELLEEYRRARDIGEDVTDPELARIIVQTRNRKKRATGGPVNAGEAYLVGERGPEMLVMGSASGRVVPNHQMSGGGNVYLDGFLVGRVLDERLGRQYGTASRVSNYRRSN